VGDEVVMVLRGRTTIFFLDGEVDRAAGLSAGEMVIVPQGTWHRFETPDEATILSVTPLQPITAPSDPRKRQARPTHGRRSRAGNSRRRR
jgi:mannose-6-phosphate isomerase-like protein (cupin superfamily)